MVYPDTVNMDGRHQAGLCGMRVNRQGDRRTGNGQRLLWLLLWLLVSHATTGAGPAQAASPRNNRVPPGTSADNPPPIQLGLPLDCVPGETCDIIKYVDNAPGPEIRDYMCGRRTGGENDYASTSIAIRDRKAMAQGVDVFAAAPGVVDRIRDSMPDTGVYGSETREELSAHGCGNAVVLVHPPHGWRTIYCHMKQGSVRVRPGERVETGQTLGQIGMSGLSELPHLYFSVRLGDVPIDPFIGRRRTEGCGLGEKPLWAPDVLARLVYKPVLLRAAGFATTRPELLPARNGDYPTDSISRRAETLYFWLEIIGGEKGDELNIRIFGPDDRMLSSGTMVFDRGAAQNFTFGSAPRKGIAEWPVGTYRAIASIKRGERSTTSIERSIAVR